VWKQTLNASQLQQLVDGLPLLRDLVLEQGALDSVAPLSSACALTSLQITMPRCFDDFRPVLPPLPNLRRLVLTIPPVWFSVYHSEESAVRRKAMLQRMPRLAKINYKEV